MRYLFIARHGEDCRKFLTDQGVKDVEALARSIHIDFDHASGKIISSSAMRTKRTAGVLHDRLGLPIPEFLDYLWTGDNKTKKPHFKRYDRDSKDKLMEIIDEHSQGIDALIVVAHYEICEDLPKFIAQQYEIKYPSVPISKGHAVVFDLEERTYKFIP